MGVRVRLRVRIGCKQLPRCSSFEVAVSDSDVRGFHSGRFRTTLI